MSGPSSTSRDGGLTRRDFVRGRFWRTKISSSRIVTSSQPARRVVMRYPRTLEEVETGESVRDVPVRNAPVRDPSSAGRHRTIPVLRPPGAIDEQDFLAGCTRCDECRQACPHDAIIHAPPQMRAAAGTPMIQAEHQACLMCEDFPCIEACEPDVLTKLVPPVMGTAIITEHLCVAHHGTACTTCSDQCPVDHAIVAVDGKPRIHEASCTGCGVCRHVCPAPENAILLMPSFARPSHPKRVAK